MSTGTRRTHLPYAQVPDFDHLDDARATPVLTAEQKADPVAFFAAKDQRVRERNIALEQTKILREQVIACYRKEGVNHYENCKDVVTQYLARIQAPDFGMVGGGKTVGTRMGRR